MASDEALLAEVAQSVNEKDLHTRGTGAISSVQSDPDIIISTPTSNSMESDLLSAKTPRVKRHSHFLAGQMARGGRGRKNIWHPEHSAVDYTIHRDPSEPTPALPTEPVDHMAEYTIHPVPSPPIVTPSWTPKHTSWNTSTPLSRSTTVPAFHSKHHHWRSKHQHEKSMSTSTSSSSSHSITSTTSRHTLVTPPPKLPPPPFGYDGRRRHKFWPRKPHGGHKVIISIFDFPVPRPTAIPMSDAVWQDITNSHTNVVRDSHPTTPEFFIHKITTLVTITVPQSSSLFVGEGYTSKKADAEKREKQHSVHAHVLPRDNMPQSAFSPSAAHVNHFQTPRKMGLMKALLETVTRTLAISASLQTPLGQISTSTLAINTSTISVQL